MPAEVKRVDVWAGAIQDRPGALAEKLEAVAKAGADLDFVIARRFPDDPGTGVVFLAPLKGTAETRAAKKAELDKATSLHSLRVEADDRPGLSAALTRAVADAGINMRGISSAAVAGRCLHYFAFDSDDDARKAARILKKLVE